MAHSHRATLSPASPPPLDVDTESCPWCGQPITHEEFREIEERIKAEERQKRARYEAQVKEQFEREEAERAAKAKAEIDQVRHEMAAAIEQEREKAAEREAVIHEEAKVTAQSEFNERLAAVEKEKLAAQEAKEAAESDKLEALKLEREKASRSFEELQVKIAKLEREKEATASAIQEEKSKSAEREAAIRAEAQESAEAAVREQLANAEKEKLAALEAKEATEREKFEALKLEREKATKSLEELQERICRLEEEKGETIAAAEEERKKAAEREAAIRAEVEEATGKQAKVDQEQMRLHYQEEIQKQREALEKDKELTLNQERAKAFSDRQKLEIKIGELKRQVQSQTAAELGEGAEVDLFESLRNEFQDDRINRIDKGEPGADIRHDVLYQGEVCGSIVYDSKNRRAWRNSYAEKLRSDQLAAEADHALLATTVLPAGESQICVRDGVIVANPARAIVIVKLLREHILQANRLRLSREQRDSKAKELYAFINSDRCDQLLRRAEELTKDLLDLEVKEKESHERTWERRGLLLRSTEKAHRAFCFEIDRIIGS